MSRFLGGRGAMFSLRQGLYAATATGQPDITLRKAVTIGVA
ncbi:hypothetical protein SAMN05421736_10867 [Evansella caseinilytica]|uniref:Uncharacterized protein n=1 Tax=Evansella caseinilytica TaxID=1503961 RepID=A0A1H3REH5_9BACI|nr:hypothetical protein [Evansella caseinilytica]SDZ24030.1 hypothetical protein SAMN05421736_10867 [Evansella caseinilytica]